MDFQEIIQFLVSGVNPICDIEEIGVVMGVATATVYGYKNQGTEPKFSQIVSLNKFLVDQKDCYVIEKVFCITRSRHSNGNVRDKLWSLHEMSTDADRYYNDAKMGKKKEKQKFFDTIQAMKEQIAKLESEGAQL